MDMYWRRVTKRTQLGGDRHGGGSVRGGHRVMQQSSVSNKPFGPHVMCQHAMFKLLDQHFGLFWLQSFPKDTK